jgi:N-acetylglucosaminyl-diphospho-decaprenol L-rhamnosyltransferase
LITASIVSHGHGVMVEKLVGSLLGCPEVGQIILTSNIPEQLNIVPNARLFFLENATPKGFAANHNAAFALCNHPFFCPLNPDIELPVNPFSELLKSLRANHGAVVAPLVVTPDGAVEDSIRYFPTIRVLLAKALGRSDGRYQVRPGQQEFFPEWVAGMFMLFRSEDFARLHGFDENFFLYYEDVDICVRAWKIGLKVLACPRVTVIHDARRDSRRSARHLRWHLASMARYFIKYWGRLPELPAELAR